jgi:RNA 2',3'-cyclic 3'-phosphodiesterase
MAEDNSHILKTKTARVFFAIKPDDAALKQLSHLAKQLASSCGGQNTKQVNIHLTLVFLGEIAIDRLDALRAAAKCVTATTFNLSFDEIRHWKHNQIIYAGMSKCAPELLALVGNLRNTLSTSGFPFDSRAFKPHITLVRKAKSVQMLPELVAPVSWCVADWFLIQSKQTGHGIKYTSLDRWILNQSSSQT